MDNPPLLLSPHEVCTQTHVAHVVDVAGLSPGQNGLYSILQAEQENLRPAVEKLARKAIAGETKHNFHFFAPSTTAFMEAARKNGYGINRPQWSKKKDGLQTCLPERQNQNCGA